VEGVTKAMSLAPRDKTLTRPRGRREVMRERTAPADSSRWREDDGER
jgi:hypothetical protein